MSPNDLSTLPFTAIYGMEDAKRSIECAVVNPNIHTVLIRGGPGSAKTMISRAAGRITGLKVVNVPLNVTEEQLFGGMDVDATIREGRPVVQKGILDRASGGILYVDDVNLMDQRVLASLLDCVTSGRVILEREGVSSEYQCDVILVATMNPEDSDISSHLLDRFDLCAYTTFPDDEKGRLEVLRRNMEFQKDPEGYLDRFKDDEEQVRITLDRAKRILPLVTISDDLVRVAVEITVRVSADGHRGDIAMVNTAKAIAAINGRDEVLKKDVEEAAMICLAHRRNYSQPPPPPEPDPPEQQEQEPPEQPPEDQQDDDKEDEQQDDEQQEEQQEQQDQSPPPQSDFEQMLEDMMYEIGEQFRV
ncbi:MAG: ATP-binding protein, partial [Candidatus Methanomethylophilaceae archaeon]|nr:ATP-binding protein [Candidatus Methanomethylophilaceae archaeon]